jgi:hypothetical protein
VQDLNDFEDNLIERFRQHRVLANMAALSEPEFASVLLQRRFLSLAFTPAYDLAIDLLRDNTIVRSARVILREEYPDSRGYTPSHREDMKEDILALGVSREELVTTQPTPQTLDTITATMRLIAVSGAHEHADLRLLTTLRFWGEVLVSVEYGRMWPRMEPRLVVNGENRSRFYYPHHIHDAKAQPLTATSPLASTHSDRLGVRLAELLADERHRSSFMEVEAEILGLKCAFYDQFVTAADRVPAGRAGQAQVS